MFRESQEEVHTCVQGWPRVCGSHSSTRSSILTRKKNTGSTCPTFTASPAAPRLAATPGRVARHLTLPLLPIYKCAATNTDPQDATVVYNTDVSHADRALYCITLCVGGGVSVPCLMQQLQEQQ